MTVELQEQVANFRVMVEGRLTAIEGKVTALGTSIDHWAAHTDKQNGRIDKIENWINDRVQDMIHAAGVLQGQQALRKRDFAVLGGIVGVISIVSGIAAQVISAIA